MKSANLFLIFFSIGHNPAKTKLPRNRPDKLQAVRFEPRQKQSSAPLRGKLFLQLDSGLSQNNGLL